MMNNRERFAQRLTALLDESSKTQADLAKYMNVSPPTITDWKKARKMPQTDKINGIADFFNVSTDYLLGKTNIPNGTVLKSVPTQAEPIDGLIRELFADRPDVLALLKNGVYDSDGKYSGKKLADLSDVAKKHLRDTIISVLEMSGYLHAK